MNPKTFCISWTVVSGLSSTSGGVSVDLLKRDFASEGSSESCRFCGIVEAVTCDNFPTTVSDSVIDSRSLSYPGWLASYFDYSDVDSACRTRDSDCSAGDSGRSRPSSDGSISRSDATPS